MIRDQPLPLSRPAATISSSTLPFARALHHTRFISSATFAALYLLACSTASSLTGLAISTPTHTSPPYGSVTQFFHSTGNFSPIISPPSAVILVVFCIPPTGFRGRPPLLDFAIIKYAPIFCKSSPSSTFRKYSTGASDCLSGNVATVPFVCPTQHFRTCIGTEPLVCGK